VIREGKEEAQRVSIVNKLSEYDEPRDFANRMNMRLHWAIERIEELEAQEAANASS